MKCIIINMLCTLCKYQVVFPRQSSCSAYTLDKRKEERTCDHLMSAARHRDHVTANQLRQKIVNILNNRQGAWNDPTHRYDPVTSSQSEANAAL